MQQLIYFDQSKAGTTPGDCLRNVRLGFGIPSLYKNATEAWDHTEQHRGDRNPPLGFDIPLYYIYFDDNGNEGHINVRLANGTVWSDGKIYVSIADYEKNHKPKYLGWGESINGIEVVQIDSPQGGGMLTTKPIDPDLVRQHLSNYTNGAVQVKSSDRVCQNRTELSDPNQGGEFWRGLNNQQLDIIKAKDAEIASLKAQLNSGQFIPVGQLYVKK